MTTVPLLSRWTLTFHDPEWEGSYRVQHERSARVPVRIVAGLGAGAMSAFLAMDPVLAGGAVGPVRAIRLVLIAVLLLVLSVSFLPRAGRYSQALATGAVVAVACGNLWMMLLSRSVHQDTYLTGQVLILILGFWGCRIRWLTTLGPLAGVGVLETGVLLLTRSDHDLLLSDLIFLSTTVAATGLLVYRSEHQERLRFLDLLVIAEEQTLLQELHRALRTAAIRDELTGLHNRRYLRVRLEEALGVAKRNPERAAALVLLDLDGFKQVNDTLGHAAGDQLLREVAGCLHRGTRSSDVVFRLGGDEFCILFQDTSPTAAAMVAGRILASVRALAPGSTEGRDLEVGFSAGCVGLAGAGSADDVLRQADVLLYEAKAAKAEGRDAPIRVAA